MKSEKNPFVHKMTEGKIAHIEFYHPAHNSLPSKLLNDLKLGIEEASNDEDINVVIIKSGGDRTFCAGASFEELLSIENTEDGKDFFMGFANVINAMRRCKKLIIGRIHGKAIGGGVGLAASMDYAIASKYASVKLSELSIGIGPFVIGPAVERKIGISAFSKLAINSTDWQTADWAKQQNLYHEVFDTSQQMDAYIGHFSTNLSEMNPPALLALKKMLWEGTDDWDNLLEKRAEISGKLINTKQAREKIMQFK